MAYNSPLTQSAERGDFFVCQETPEEAVLVGVDTSPPRRGLNFFNAGTRPVASIAIHWGLPGIEKARMLAVLSAAVSYKCETRPLAL
jgi:hypothetical protein